MSDKTTVKTEVVTNDFDKLLGELNNVHKSLPADDAGTDDEKIEAASGDADADVDADTDTGNDVDADNDKDAEVTKSFEVVMADGSKAEAYDATDLLKSLTGRIEKNESTLATVLVQTLDVVKSLQAQVNKLSAAGKGRKAVLTVHEKTSEEVAKSDASANEISVDAFMAKALTAQVEGRVSALDIAKCESHLNRGQKIPDDIVKRVMGQ